MNRRRLLTASGASLASVGATGCLGSETEESVFEEITGSGWNLEVSLVEDAQIDEISLVNLDGDVFAGGSLEVGQRSAGSPLTGHDFSEIQSAYTPGKEYTIAAVDADGNRHEHSLTLEPDIEHQVTLTDELNGDPTVASSLWYFTDTRLVEAARE